MARGTKRILVISDNHSGHFSGLTPPDWWFPEVSDAPWRQSVSDYQRWSWNTYCSYLDELRPFDRLIHLGDAIDGKATKNGGCELLTSDREEQCDMAVQVVKQTRIGKIVMVRGTKYHTGVSEDWENQVARGCKADIGDHKFIEVNGITISARHFVGGTQNPKSKATAILGAQVSNDQWCREYKDHPKAQIFLRGHVHRCTVVDEPSTLSVTAPALQGWTQYGAQKCSQPVHFGIMAIDITPAGNWSWHRLTAQLAQPVHVVKW